MLPELLHLLIRDVIELFHGILVRHLKLLSAQTTWDEPANLASKNLQALSNRINPS